MLQTVKWSKIDSDYSSIDGKSFGFQEKENFFRNKLRQSPAQYTNRMRKTCEDDDDISAENDYESY